MKVITLSQDTIIDECLYRKGQVVQVADNFGENVEKVIASTIEIKKREDNLKQKIQLEKEIKVEKDKPKKVK